MQNINIKTISGYAAVLSLSLLLHSMKPLNRAYYGLLPILMLIFPILVGYRVKIRFPIKDILLGLGTSLVILLPYHLFFGGDIQKITAYSILFQLLSVAIPEEFFFRGFLQDSMGRNMKAVIMASLLFSIAHLPKVVFLGEWMTLLSFFPSLIMGWLYMKTNNILPGTIFHLFANLVYYP